MTSSNTLFRRLKRAIRPLFTRYYEGADCSKEARSWNSLLRTSANVENQFAAPILSNRARDLVQNSPYAHRALEAIVNNTVGNGIIPQIRCADEGKRKDIVDIWKEWSESAAIDAEGRKSFYEIQAQVLRTVACDGDALVRIIPNKNASAIPYQLQILEPDYLDSYKEFKTYNGFICSGIEFEKAGNTYQRKAYWLFKEHPGGFINNYPSFSAFSEAVPASQIMHVFRSERPGAVRGVSWFHPVINHLRDLHDYQSSVLTQQKLANCFTVFIRKSGGLATSLMDKAKEILTLRPGLIYKLDIDEEVTFAAPPPPSATYGDYCNHILRSIAGGLGITAECLSQDLSEVNFSSGKMGFIEMSRNIDNWRYRVLIPQLCNPTWQLFTQALSFYGIDTSDVGISWTPPARAMIDPSKEMESLQLAIRNGLITYSEALRSLGEDPDSHMEEIARDFRRLKQLGIKLDCDPEKDLSPNKPQPPIQTLRRA